MSKNLAFLRHTDRITYDKSIWKQHKEFTVVTVDTGDLGYAGIDTIINELRYKPTILNIDHHASNTQYGDLNLVIETASSTTEILYNFFKYNNIPITRNMATSLMTGLIYDTGSFSNAGTSRRALTIGSELIRLGADMNAIKQNMLKNKSVNALKLWGLVLSRLNLHPEHNIAHTFLKQDDIEKHGVTEEELEGIANLLNHLGDGDAVMLIKERKEGGIKVSMRTTKDHVDVSVIAKHFGGGGHTKAAGFSLEHTLDEAIEHIFEALTVHELAFVQA